MDSKSGEYGERNRDLHSTGKLMFPSFRSIWERVEGGRWKVAAGGNIVWSRWRKRPDSYYPDNVVNINLNVDSGYIYIWCVKTSHVRWITITCHCLIYKVSLHWKRFSRVELRMDLNIQIELELEQYMLISTKALTSISIYIVIDILIKNNQAIKLGMLNLYIVGHINYERYLKPWLCYLWFNLDKYWSVKSNSFSVYFCHQIREIG